MSRLAEFNAQHMRRNRGSGSGSATGTGELASRLREALEKRRHTLPCPIPLNDIHLMLFPPEVHNWAIRAKEATKLDAIQWQNFRRVLNDTTAQVLHVHVGGRTMFVRTEEPHVQPTEVGTAFRFPPVQPMFGQLTGWLEAAEEMDHDHSHLIGEVVEFANLCRDVRYVPLLAPWLAPYCEPIRRWHPSPSDRANALRRWHGIPETRRTNLQIYLAEAALLPSERVKAWLGHCVE